MPYVHHSTAKATSDAFQAPSYANARHGSIIQLEWDSSGLRAAVRPERHGYCSSVCTSAGFGSSG